MLVIRQFEEVGAFIDNCKMPEPVSTHLTLPHSGDLGNSIDPILPFEAKRPHSALLEYGNHIYGFFHILIHITIRVKRCINLTSSS
ncbi:MAG: hypothetical protein KKG33_13810 [candidate division Zixibacteria bacterium]|nr:hypothetical protein [candidate division Zixibacteria bacterium]